MHLVFVCSFCANKFINLYTPVLLQLFSNCSFYPGPSFSFHILQDERLVMKQVLKNIAAVYLTKRSRKHSSVIDELETKQIESSKKSFADSIYFAGISNEGFCFVTRQSFSADKPNENWFMINIPGEGTWGIENRQLDEGEGFRQGALEYVCSIPGEEWKISYEGTVEQGNEENEIKLEIDWVGATPIALLDKIGVTDLQTGKQLAKEEWTIPYLNKIRRLEKLEYEQAGKMIGIVEWKGKTHKLKFAGFRSHSRGIHNWPDLDCNLWISGFLEDGRYFSIRLTNFNFVKNLRSAFIYDNGQFFTIYNIPTFDKLDINFLNPGSFSFPVQEVMDGPIKQFSVELLSEFPYRVHPDYQIRQAEATFEYNGVKGIGIVEMGFNLKKYETGMNSGT